MNKKHNYNLIRENITLTQKERESLWENIVAVNEFSNPIKIDDQIFDSEYIRPLWLRSLAGFAGTAMAATLLFVASNHALPGEILYALKTDVSEPIQRFSTVDIEDKLLLEQKLITKRVLEAKELKSRGQLDQLMAKQIEAQISKQAKSVLSKTEPDDVNSEETADEINTASAAAETKGTAVGSIDAVKVLSGKPLEIDEITGSSKTSVNLDNEIKLEKKKTEQSTVIENNVKETIKTDRSLEQDSIDSQLNRIESETAKQVIKAKAQESVSKVEVETLPKLKQSAQTQKDVKDVQNDPKTSIAGTQKSSLNDVDKINLTTVKTIEQANDSVDTISEIVEFTEKQIQQTKTKLNQSDQSNTGELLKAVEDAAATNALTKGLE